MIDAPTDTFIQDFFQVHTFDPVLVIFALLFIILVCLIAILVFTYREVVREERKTDDMLARSFERGKEREGRWR